MATSSEQLEKLIKMRTGYEYTPKTAEQIKAQAEGEYQSYYDQLRLAAKQAQESNDLRLQQQITGLKSTYDQQREDSAKQYRQTYSQADRQLLSRGMQRSSYGASTLVNINLEGAKAEQRINDAQALATSNIEDQRTQLQQQYNAQMSQYSASQAADVLNRQRQLEDTEYQRKVDALKSQTTLEQAIYSAMYQKERDTIADEQWQKQFAESQRQFNENFALESFRYGYNQPTAEGGGGGGGGGGGDSYSSPSNNSNNRNLLSVANTGSNSGLATKSTIANTSNSANTNVKTGSLSSKSSSSSSTEKVTKTGSYRR